MQLRLLNFSALVQTMAAGVQSASARLVDLSVGSVLRAVLEANAAVALWMQWLVLRVLQTTRAASSAGADLDSWMADFALARLPAVAASGTVTFSRQTAGLAAFVPVGAQVRTGDGAQIFAVLADAANPAFDAARGGYALAPTAAAMDVAVGAVAAGAAGNVLAGAIAQLASALAGIDSVTNALALSGGMDAESDAALRRRFQDYMDTRSRATPRAIGFAIAGVQQGLSFVIAENVDAAGAPQPGGFVVTVDDGSGAPSAALLAAVAQAVEAVRPIGSRCAVQPPVLLGATISATLTLAPDADGPTVRAAVGAAIANFVNALPIGASLALSRIAQIAHDTDPAVRGVGPVLLNGIAATIAPPANGVVKPSLVSVL